MDSNDFVSTEEVVAEATIALSDENFTHGIGKSLYEMYAHRAIESLAINTFFAKVTKDIFDWNSCGSGILPMPKNMFNIKELYLFNSSCDKSRCSDNDSCIEQKTCCSSKSCWTQFVEAHWKREFNKFGSTRLKTAKIAPGHADPVYLKGANYVELTNISTRTAGTLVYFGVQNGEIAFSDNAILFKNVRIVANGFGATNCELPIIPRPLRNVVIDMIKVSACQKLMIIYPEYKQMYSVYYTNLNGDGSLSNPGSMLLAQRYISSLNSKQRKDLFEYFGNADVK